MSFEYYIGIMSGTSLDGADAVLCRCSESETQFVAHHYVAYSDKLKWALFQLLTPGDNEIERTGSIEIQLAHVYADLTLALLAKSDIRPQKVRAIGVHGQTVRHCPQNGFTVQLNHPALLAELTGIDVIADFRSRDMAAGGEGAPLVPAFHAAMFASSTPRAIVNIGGIANVTRLTDNTVTGFDCGPGNTLLDCWIQKQRGLSYDKDAQWAKTGKIHKKLLTALLADPYFQRTPPKSTGREYFNLAWLEKRYPDLSTVACEDVERTLVSLTVQTIADAVGDIHEIFLCGGGAFNPLLVEELRQKGLAVKSTSAIGIDPMHVESMAFAWLAYCFCHKKAGNLPAVTRAQGPRILGALYPA